MRYTLFGIGKPWKVKSLPNGSSPDEEKSEKLPYIKGDF